MAITKEEAIKQLATMLAESIFKSPNCAELLEAAFSTCKKVCIRRRPVFRRIEDDRKRIIRLESTNENGKHDAFILKLKWHIEAVIMGEFFTEQRDALRTYRLIANELPEYIQQWRQGVRGKFLPPSKLSEYIHAIRPNDDNFQDAMIRIEKIKDEVKAFDLRIKEY